MITQNKKGIYACHHAIGRGKVIVHIMVMGYFTINTFNVSVLCAGGIGGWFDTSGIIITEDVRILTFKAFYFNAITVKEVMQTICYRVGVYCHTFTLLHIVTSITG